MIWQNGTMRVAEHHDVGPFAGDADFEIVAELPRFDDVLHQEAAAVERDGFRELEFVGGIRVAEHGGERSDLFQLKADDRGPDVAGVQDMIDAVEEPGNFRIEKIMRVGDDADFHGEVSEVSGARCQVSGAVRSRRESAGCFT